jgi:hypothetical protein
MAFILDTEKIRIKMNKKQQCLMDRIGSLNRINRNKVEGFIMGIAAQREYLQKTEETRKRRPLLVMKETEA